MSDESCDERALVRDEDDAGEFHFYFSKRAVFFAALEWCAEMAIDAAHPFNFWCVVIPSKKNAALFKLFWNEFLCDSMTSWAKWSAWESVRRSKL